ncbi:phage tail protein [Citrobacter freundii]|uniref:phage tail protein n=1 Tax=Citrobacter freundii TaxID=546 RepID=UPI0028F85D78|nr:phage tail protein [Citrobacter freundii]MDT9772657.1 phage tail protein [Citrobacter freundii]
MTAKYLAILTNQGAARLANAAALGTKLNLTQMAVGDANGTLPTPDPAQTKLINQKRIAPLNLLTVDPANTSQIIAEQIIPENEGGFWIREIGLYDDDGILIAVANCPETYKPQLQEGSGRTQTIRMILIVSSTSSITLKIDPSVVLATRKYADDKAIELKLYVDDLMSKHLAAADPHSQYATKDSPTFTGKPKAPTPPVVANDTQVATAGFVQAVIAALVSGELANKQPLDKTLTDLSGKDVAAILEYLRIGEIYAPLKDPSFIGTPTVPNAEQNEIDFRIANTAFVAQAIADLNGGAPAVLNTLKKLASAINNDANFYSTVNSALGQKASLSEFTSSKTSTSVVGNQPGGLWFMCGYITVPTDSNGNIFITLPDTFLGGVVYCEAHQCGSSYVGDNSPFVFSSYQPASGPTSSISFAVRATTTGAPLINDSIQLMYFVRGY